jgi:uncharacterized membrane protein
MELFCWLVIDDTENVIGPLVTTSLYVSDVVILCGSSSSDTFRRLWKTASVSLPPKPGVYNLLVSVECTIPHSISKEHVYCLSVIFLGLVFVAKNLGNSTCGTSN